MKYFSTLLTFLYGSSCIYSIHDKVLIDNFTNVKINKQPLPDATKPEIFRTILDNTFSGECSDNPKFNIIANGIFKKNHPIELANASAILDYEFVNPLPFNKGYYVNFYMESIKSPFNIKIDYHERVSAIKDASWVSPEIHCFPGQNLYSVPINGYGLRKVNDIRISFTAQESNYKGSLGLIDEIHFNEVDPVPEPLSLISIGSGLLGLTRKKRLKRSV